MESQSRSDASRANGANSHGPVTPEGKARSSQNARKHGLTSGFSTLPGESQTLFEQLLDSYVGQFEPVGPLECELVRTFAIASWRLRRIPAIEGAVLENETVQRQEQIDRQFTSADDINRLGFVFGKLADYSQVLPLLIRYETSLTRIQSHTLKQLTDLQKLRNEPKPVPIDQPADRPIGPAMEP